MALTCSYDVSVKLWQVGSQECLFTLRHEASLTTGTFSTTGTTVVTTTIFPQRLKQWCVRSGDCISTLKLSGGGDFDFAFTARRVHVLHTVQDCVALWNMETGARLWGHPFFGRDLPFSNGGKKARLSRRGNWFCAITHRRNWDEEIWDGVEIWNATTCSMYHSVTVSIRDGPIEPLVHSLPKSLRYSLEHRT